MTNDRLFLDVFAVVLVAGAFGPVPPLGKESICDSLSYEELSHSEKCFAVPACVGK